MKMKTFDYTPCQYDYIKLKDGWKDICFGRKD